MKDKTGKLIVISAPSGTGKSTVVKRLLEKTPNIIASVSFTTRPMRENEQEGVDYFFVDKKKFETMVDNNEFIEHATVFGNYYGTSRSSVDEIVKKKCNVLFDIDWKGAKQLSDFKELNLLKIFILPPNKEELKKRLIARNQDDEESIKNRLLAYSEDVNHSNEYDHVIINDNAEKCFNEIKEIISKKVKL